MVDLITNNPQVFRQTKKAVSESIHDTTDYKLSKSGKKVKAHRVSFDDEEKEEVKEEILIGESLSSDPPFVVLLKRTAIVTGKQIGRAHV